MQVRKFEARSMKEALEMVKNDLGPDAIIISARDYQSKFGLLSRNSVEVTAAIPEEKLFRKKFAESKMAAKDIEKLRQSPARVQRDYLEKAWQEHTAAPAPEPVKRSPTQTRYADIDDEMLVEKVAPSGPRVDDVLMSMQTNNGELSAAERDRIMHKRASERIRSAVQSAWEVGQQTIGSVAPAVTKASQPQTQQILSLQKEVARLHALVENFQKVPQSLVQPPSVTSQTSAHWPSSFNEIAAKLTQAGVEKRLVEEIFVQAEQDLPRLQQVKPALVEAWVAKFILGDVQIASGELARGMHFFFGPNGVGRTQSLINMASLELKNPQNRLLIVSANDQKIGAFEQLKIFGQLLAVPVMSVRTRKDWFHVLKNMAQFTHILVDLPSLSANLQTEYMHLFSLLTQQNIPLQKHLILSAGSRFDDLYELMRRHRALNFNDLIFTFVDQATRHGVIYSFMKEFNLPLYGLSLGAKVPDDFELATRERVLDLIFKLSETAESA